MTASRPQRSRWSHGHIGAKKYYDVVTMPEFSSTSHRDRPLPRLVLSSGAGEGLEDAPSADPVDTIGRQVAAHRAQQGMRVSELARIVGVSSSLVSQIEHGRSRPSVSTLFAIAEALNLPVDAFFRQDEQELPRPAIEEPSTSHDSRYVVRRFHRAVIEMDNGVRWERLTPSSLLDVEFLELIYQPHAESHSTLYRHPGQEMLVMLSGQLDIYAGFECHQLKAGDSMHFPSMTPHRYVNSTNEPAHAITTILHDPV